MGFNALLLETLGSVFICLVVILFIMYVYGRLAAKCIGKRSSTEATRTASSGSRSAVAGSQTQATEILPPPSYDELFYGEIFVIHIEDEEKLADGPNMHDEQLPTYDEATGISFPA